jgi:hypothetical protein
MIDKFLANIFPWPCLIVTECNNILKRACISNDYSYIYMKQSYDFGMFSGNKLLLVEDRYDNIDYVWAVSYKQIVLMYTQTLVIVLFSWMKELFKLWCNLFFSFLFLYLRSRYIAVANVPYRVLTHSHSPTSLYNFIILYLLYKPISD